MITAILLLAIVISAIIVTTLSKKNNNTNIDNRIYNKGHYLQASTLGEVAKMLLANSAEPARGQDDPLRISYERLWSDQQF